MTKGSSYIESGLTNLYQTKTRTLSANKELLSEEQMLLGKTLQPTLFIPDVGKQSYAPGAEILLR